MRLLIHIGYHKTNTTWLQSKVFDRQASGFWPVSENGNDSREFGWEFLYGRGLDCKNKGKLASPFDFDAAAVRKRLESLLARANGHPVISHEDLSGQIWSGNVSARELADRLYATAPNAKILITVREQCHLIRSAYYHYLWAGGLCSLSSFISTYNELQAPLFNPASLRYDKLVDYYQMLFGKERVSVLPYEFFVSDPENFLSQVYALAEIQVPSGFSADTLDRVNTRSPAVNMAQCMTRLINLLGDRNNLNARIAVGSSSIRHRFTEKLAQMLPASAARRRQFEDLRLIRAQLVDFFSESNSRLESQTGLKLAPFGYEIKSEIHSG